MVGFRLHTDHPDGERLALPGTLLGMGLGGFVDGIVLHQLLQWHHMISSQESPTTVLGLERNTLWDGVFHVFAWLAVVIGLFLLWSRLRRGGRPRASRTLWGWVIFGCGVFNLADGLVNHLILGIHHVRDDLGGPLGRDIGFLVVSLALAVAGWWLAHRVGPDVTGRS